MKNLLLLFFVLFSFNLFSQDWKEIKTENNILIEFTTQELHNESLDIHQEYYVLKLTNVSDSLVSFSFDVIVNGKVYTDRNVSINLPPNQYEQGNLLNTSGDELTIFRRFLPNNSGNIVSDTRINNFEIQINTN